MKILHLTLKRQWFDMIASGEKKEEYREKKQYWINRLAERYTPCVLFEPVHYDVVRFTNGYAKDAPTMDVECRGIDIRTGKEEWGAEPHVYYFVINLGRILSRTHC